MNWGELLVDQRHPSYPLVRGLVADLRRDYLRWRETVREYELASAASTPESSDAAAELAATAQALAVDIQSYVAEINYLGVELDVRRLFLEETEDAP